MEWQDEGFVLTAWRHGESAAVLEVFTAAHGRHAGVVRGGGSRRMAPLLQPGARLALVWSARLEEHVGAFRVDPIGSRTAVLLGDGAALAALSGAPEMKASAAAESAASGVAGLGAGFFLITINSPFSQLVEYVINIKTMRLSVH